MKKIIIILSLLICIFFVSGLASASITSSGSASIPGFLIAYNSATSSWKGYFWISNITSETISVQVTFYYEDGTMISDASTNASGGILQAVNTTNYNESTTDHSLSFDLAANNTAYIKVINTGTNTYAYGLIEWSQNSKAIKGLVANGYCQYYETITYGQDSSNIPINYGEPF